MSGRQVLLHILPGDPGYGGEVLGLHLYSWAFIVFATIIAGQWDHVNLSSSSW